MVSGDRPKSCRTAAARSADFIKVLKLVRGMLSRGLGIEDCDRHWKQ